MQTDAGVARSADERITQEALTFDDVLLVPRRSSVIPHEIGILHEKKHVHKHYRPLVPQGVQLYEVKRQTGLEYKAVFIPRVQDLFDRAGGISWEEYVGRERLKSYMTMTRARTRLYLLYEDRWPRLLEPIRPYVEWIEH